MARLSGKSKTKRKAVVSFQFLVPNVLFRGVIPGSFGNGTEYLLALTGHRRWQVDCNNDEGRLVSQGSGFSLTRPQ